MPVQAAIDVRSARPTTTLIAKAGMHSLILTGIQIDFGDLSSSLTGD